MIPVVRITAIVVLLSACSPQAPPPPPKPIATTTPEAASKPDKSAEIAPFLGHWRQSAVVVAPWFDGKSEKPEPDPEFALKDVVLTATSSSGPGIVNCESAVYSPTSLPLDSLFERKLKDPAKDAARLGVQGADIPSVLQSCKSSTGDLELLFHLTDPETLMLALDNMVYTLKRVPAPPGGWPAEPAVETQP